MKTITNIKVLAVYALISQIALSSSTLISNISADTTLHFKQAGKQATDQSETIYIKNGKIHFSESDTNEGEYSIFDSQNHKLIHVNPARQAYIEIDENAIDQQMGEMKQQMDKMMAQMKEQMKNMPPEQRAMMEKMMGQGGPSGQMPAMMQNMPKKQQINTHKTDIIAGIKCDIVEIKVESKIIEELCVASEEQFNIAANDKKALKEMNKFINKMAEKASSFTGEKAMTQQLDGVPIRTREYDRMGKMVYETTLHSITTDSVSHDKVSVPATYKKQSMQNNF